jgi:DNA-binding transcriptional ArsR family regulator
VGAYEDAPDFAALAELMRRAILERLAEQPRSVSALAGTLPVSRPAVSQHLRVPKAAGLVSDAAIGTRRVYRLNPEGVVAFRDQLDAFWARTLSGYQDTIGYTTTEEI